MTEETLTEREKDLITSLIVSLTNETEKIIKQIADIGEDSESKQKLVTDFLKEMTDIPGYFKNTHYSGNELLISSNP